MLHAISLFTLSRVSKMFERELCLNISLIDWNRDSQRFFVDP